MVEQKKKVLVMDGISEDGIAPLYDVAEVVIKNKLTPEELIDEIGEFPVPPS